mmetsp:Transcript_95895/g.310889  ORF Transcript_95895/g.310889 Transcript_95895/m.310889 type:complete len:240 (+) Transcript_95895:1062-1781(+)
MHEVRGVEQKQRLLGVVRLDDALNVPQEYELLIVGAIEFRRRAIVQPQIRNIQIQVVRLIVLRPEVFATLRLHALLRPIVVLVLKINQRGLVTSASRRMLVSRHSDIPLAYVVRVVTRGPQLFGDARHVARHTRVRLLRVLQRRLHVHRQAARLRRGAGGSARTVDVVPGQVHTFTDELVDRRRPDLPTCRAVGEAAVETNVSEAEVVHEDEDQVRRSPGTAKQQLHPEGQTAQRSRHR